jgi:hypothetical protein
MSSSPIISGDSLEIGPIPYNFFDVSRLMLPGSAYINGPVTLGANPSVLVPRANIMMGPGIVAPITLEVIGAANYFGLENKFSLRNIFGLSNFFGLKNSFGLSLKQGISLKNALDLTNAITVANGINYCTAADFTPFISAGNGLFTDLTVAGIKKFEISHPSKPGYKLVHACIEGPESGVYYRGRLRRSNEIWLPDYWENLVDFRTITVHLTPRRHHQELYVKETVDNKFIRIENNIESTIDCDYIICAERVDVKKLVVERKENDN